MRSKLFAFYFEPGSDHGQGSVATAPAQKVGDLFVAIGKLNIASVTSRGFFSAAFRAAASAAAASSLASLRSLSAASAAAAHEVG
eukprot:CAMPEP_0172693398 /NCGR_PEP_ID=MMETSP1074-20121228/25962_1 /TAXON_ID=2916 /ORGANISM="Ceratium fusus, Strain PA161109" /LENGTH=84 /DNA_ID=CAMNT_0013513767 /DNA_START=504 /DNA_END=756 /DNA_ORIENTATION=+